MTSTYFLYKTVIGRCFLKILTRPFFSKMCGAFLNTSLSKPMIKHYTKKYDIDLNEYEKKNYDCFNSFFTRKRKILDINTDKSAFISPCDGYLSVYKIDDNSVYHVKNVDYSLSELLKSEKEANEYKNGLCFIFRLAPHNFHRYCFEDSGEIIYEKKIDGILHCVRPLATSSCPVYIQNSREYTKIKTDNFSDVIQMEVGAMIVGKIKNNKHGKYVLREQEKGYFEFGGSTVIVLVKENILEYEANDEQTEIPVKIGTAVAKKRSLQFKDING